MLYLEARARVLAALAVVLAVALYAATAALGGDVWRGIPNVLGLLALVALPGWLLGRTGFTARVGVLCYESALSYATAGMVALGVLATGRYVVWTSNPALSTVSILLVAWAPWGVAGYALGLASTVAEDVIWR